MKINNMNFLKTAEEIQGEICEIQENPKLSFSIKVKKINSLLNDWKKNIINMAIDDPMKISINQYLNPPLSCEPSDDNVNDWFDGKLAYEMEKNFYKELNFDDFYSLFFDDDNDNCKCKRSTGLINAEDLYENTAFDDYNLKKSNNKNNE